MFQSRPRPITEPGKGNYWVLDVSKGEGYKRARIRRTRAQKREAEAAAAAAAAQAITDASTSNPEPSTKTKKVTSRKTRSRASKSSTPNRVGFATDSEHEPTAASPSFVASDDANIDPALRDLDQGHIVGEGRSRSRRVISNRSSPYPQQNSSSPSTHSATALTSSSSQMTVPSYQSLAPLQIPVQYGYHEVPAVEISQAYVESRHAYHCQDSFEPQSSFGPSSTGYSSSTTSPASVPSLLTPDTEYVMVTDGGLPRARRVSPTSGISSFTTSPGHGIRVLSDTPPEMMPEQDPYDGHYIRGKEKV